MVVGAWVLTWSPVIFMALIAFVLWRTMKMMPRTKPQQIKPEAKSALHWADVAGAEEAKHELEEVVSAPPIYHPRLGLRKAARAGGRSPAGAQGFRRCGR